MKYNPIQLYIGRTNIEYKNINPLKLIGKDIQKVKYFPQIFLSRGE